MRMIILIFLFVVIGSCTINRINSDHSCPIKPSFWSYSVDSNFFYKLELQQLGLKYPAFRIDTCLVVSKRLIKIRGYIEWLDNDLPNGSMRLSGAKITLAEREKVADLILINPKNIGETSENGNFDIDLPTQESEIFILITKEKYRPLVVRITW